MIFKIKRKEFTPDVIGVYFTAGGDTVYKTVFVKDGYIRFAYLESFQGTIVVSHVKFSFDEFNRNLRNGSLIQINPTDHRIPLPLLSYEV